jgi:polyisoprenoid-binding protein YceI
MAQVLPTRTKLFNLKKSIMAVQTFDIIGSQSGIEWTGRKVTGTHNGTIGIKAGTITMDKGKLTGATIIIDIQSIKILDVTDPGTNAQFAAHLASDDFFSADAFPTATFDTTSVTPVRDNLYHVDGNLTIKGITGPVIFDAIVDVSGGIIKATGKITIDRTKYEMKFRSGNFFKDLGDTLIYNDFDLNVNVTAKGEPVLAVAR